MGTQRLPALPPATGRVVEDATGAPLPNARVTITASGVGVPVVLTTEDGGFSLPVPAEHVGIVATKAGYQKGQTVARGDGAPVEIRLRRSAAIEGRVMDEFGDPVVGMPVTVDRFETVGRQALVARTETDDRGEYRIGGLAADTFAVSVMTSTWTVIEPRPGRTGVQQQSEPLFFPGVSGASDAQPIVLTPGSDLSGVDFVVPANHGLPDSLLSSLGVNVTAGFGFATAGSGTTTGRSINMTFAGLDPRTPPPEGKGVVRGQVLSAGRPLARAEVRLSSVSPSRANANQGARSDSDGRFEFRDVPAGTVRVTALKPGYFSDERLAGQQNPVPIFELAESEVHEGVEIRLAPWASIEGRVVDERGEPIADAIVRLLHPRYEDGQRRLVSVDIHAPLTDDRGHYRLYGIPPGQYLVSATVGDVSTGELPGYGRGYFPGASDPGMAQYISVGPGGELLGIEISLARIRTARVSGTLLDSKGRPTMGGSVRLVPAGSVVGVADGARIERNGAFEFVNVPPGQYVIQMSAGRTSGYIEGDFAALPVAVSGADISGLVVQASPGSTVTGRISFDTNDPDKAPRSSAFALLPIPVDPLFAPSNQLANASIDSSGAFQLAGLTGARRLQVTRAPAGWALEAVRVDGIEVTDQALVFGGPAESLHDVEVVLTDRFGAATGTIADERGRPAAGAGVIIYSTDHGTWYASSRFVRKTTADASGNFAVRGLPAGRYYAAAVPRLPADGEDAWQDPQYLDALSVRASSIAVADSTSTNVQLRLSSLPSP
jgi:protocatechuate 3,4-dioxygenase beta subunit